MAYATGLLTLVVLLFAEIVPKESAAERLKRFKPLIAKHAGSAEARLLEAELQIAAEDFPAARRALGDLTQIGGDGLTHLAGKGVGADIGLAEQEPFQRRQALNSDRGFGKAVGFKPGCVLLAEQLAQSPADFIAPFGPVIEPLAAEQSGDGSDIPVKGCRPAVRHCVKSLFQRSCVGAAVLPGVALGFGGVGQGIIGGHHNRLGQHRGRGSGFRLAAGRYGAEHSQTQDGDESVAHEDLRHRD